MGNSRDDERRYPLRPLLAASTAVFRDGRVLVAQRAAAPSSGLWSLPGGLVEPGERLAEAAARELHEETGLTARLIAPAELVEVIRPDGEGRAERHYVIVAFAALWLEGIPNPRDGTTAVRWLRVDEIDSLNLTEGTASAIRKAAKLAGVSDEKG